MIRVAGVCKDYPSELGGHRRVLNEMSFELARGEKIAVLGRNGAGKSTLIRLLGGVELPTSGTIERTMSLSWPIAMVGGVHGVLTGNDNIRFIARVYGKPFQEMRDFVDDFAQLGTVPVGAGKDLFDRNGGAAQFRACRSPSNSTAI